MNKFLRFSIIATFLLIPSTVFAASFSDVNENHPNFIAIETLKQEGVINGYPDGTFRPDNKVNRAESLKMIIIASGINFDENAGWENFSDVENSEWFYNYISFAVQNETISGYNDGTFKPGNNINLAEALKMSFKSFNFTEPINFDSPYPDVPKDYWFAPYASFTKSKNITSADPNDGFLHAEKEMTRGQLAELLYRFKNIPGDGYSLIEAARNQIGVVTKYDTSYYQGGYPPEDSGACTDVIEHALRDTGYDLKTKIDNDMWTYPNRYPHDPDPNINYRRVVNVKIFFDNYAQSLSTCTDNECLKQEIWQPGDIVTYNQMEGGLWHIAIISDKTRPATNDYNTQIPLLIHNYGRGTVEDNMLLTWPASISGHYRVL